MTIDFIRSEKANHSKMQVVPQPSKWFTLQGQVTDSQASRFLSRVRAGNAGLGNHYRNIHGTKHAICPFCDQAGVRSKLREFHVAFCCKVVERQLISLGLAHFRNTASCAGWH